MNLVDIILVCFLMSRECGIWKFYDNYQLKYFLVCLFFSFSIAVHQILSPHQHL
jgi:hypothetical protein